MKIVHKRAYHDYSISETIEAGIFLTGAEVKSIKTGHMNLEGSFVRIIGSEVYLVNAQIYPYPYARQEGYDQKRSRKLLLHKREIIALKSKSESQRLTLIPLECYTIGSLIKLKIGIGKGKKEFEKREKIKRRDIDRDVERELRGKKDKNR